MPSGRASCPTPGSGISLRPAVCIAVVPLQGHMTQGQAALKQGCPFLSSLPYSASHMQCMHTCTCGPHSVFLAWPFSICGWETLAASVWQQLAGRLKSLGARWPTAQMAISGNSSSGALELTTGISSPAFSPASHHGLRSQEPPAAW